MYTQYRFFNCFGNVVVEWYNTSNVCLYEREPYFE